MAEVQNSAQHWTCSPEWRRTRDAADRLGYQGEEDHREVHVWPLDSAPYLDPSFLNTALPSQFPSPMRTPDSPIYFGHSFLFGHFIPHFGIFFFSVCSSRHNHPFSFAVYVLYLFQRPYKWVTVKQTNFYLLHFVTNNM